MCQSRSQTVSGDSYGYIQSQDYPRGAPATNGSCFVTLTVATLSTVELSVDRQFDLLTNGTPATRNQCYYAAVYFWIKAKRQVNSVCGKLEDGYVFKVIYYPRSSISFGFNYVPRGTDESFFSVKYSGRLLYHVQKTTRGKDRG